MIYDGLVRAATAGGSQDEHGTETKRMGTDSEQMVDIEYIEHRQRVLAIKKDHSIAKWKPLCGLSHLGGIGRKELFSQNVPF